MSLLVRSLNRCKIRAFTLLESLLVLSLVSLLTLFLSGSVTSTFGGIEEKLFFLNFEQVYLDSQKLSSSQQTPVVLTLSDRQISNGYQTIQLPASLDLVQEQSITFSAGGGNSSLAKIGFRTRNEQVTYQLYIGSGKYKQTRQSLHTP